MQRFSLLALASCSTSSGFSLSQYNVTLTFASQPSSMGQYISGDWWLVGPVTLIGTDPAASAGRNGFEISPASIFKQPYDSRAAGYDESLLPALPVTVAPGNSIVKMTSLLEWNGSNPTYVETAVIVTIVAAPPIPNTYRPAYFRNNSAVTKQAWSASQLRWDLYPSLALPPTPACPPAPPALCTPPPPIDEVVTQRYAMPQIDHLNGWTGGQIHPTVNMPGCHYGEAIVQASGLAATLLLLNYNASTKAAAAHGLVQYGIDIGGIVAGGGFWSANGGWQNGRKIVLGLASLVLGAAAMTDLTAGVPIDPQVTFSEDTEVWVAPHAASPGGVLWGALPSVEDAYWKLVVSGNGDRIMADPYGYIDGGPFSGGYYDFCCVYKPWKGEALPQLMSAPLEELMSASGTNMLPFVLRRYRFGTWALPDPCAPPTGACSDGSGRCAGWLGMPCGASAKGHCVLDLKDYGVLFGPSNSTPGQCIAGPGRFPGLHGQNVDAGDGEVDFVERMFAALVNSTGRFH